MWARASLEGHSVDACAEHLGAGMVEAGMAAACPVHLLCLAAEGDRLAKVPHDARRALIVFITAMRY